MNAESDFGPVALEEGRVTRDCYVAVGPCDVHVTDLNPLDLCGNMHGPSGATSEQINQRGIPAWLSMLHHHDRRREVCGTVGEDRSQRPNTTGRRGDDDQPRRRIAGPVCHCLAPRSRPWFTRDDAA